MTDRILFIDDEVNVLAAFQRVLRKTFDVTVAVGAEKGLAEIKASPPFAVVVCDMRMPDIDGVETLKRIAATSADTVRIMLTGNADQETAVRAINEGNIFRFLTKPCPDEVLRATLKAALRQYELVTAEKTLLEQTLAGSVKVLMDVLSVSQPEAYGRAARARNWARPLVKAADWTLIWEIEMAILLAPIGLISVPPEVVEKSQHGQTLSQAEHETLARAPEAAHRLISHIPRMHNVAAIVLHQDRGFDGSGVPADGPMSEAIPLGARVLRLLKDLAAAGNADLPDAGMIAKVCETASVYDPAVLAEACHLWGGSQAAVVPKARVRKSVAAGGLLPDDRLVSDVLSESGQLMLGAGLQITMAQIERLRSLERLRRIAGPIVIDRMVTVPQVELDPNGGRG